MKAVAVCMSSHRNLHKPDSCCMAGKSSPTKADFDSKEMRDCFKQLMDMVPGEKGPDGHMDKMQVLQNVINYIYDLQDALQAVSTGGFCVYNSSSSTYHDHSSAGSPDTAMTTDELLSDSSVPGLTRLNSL